MKNILILFAHPNYESSRVNNRLITAAEGLSHVTVRDLYQLYPDFNIDVVDEQEALFGHDIVIWHHPFYWYSCPPLLKQWIDLVLQYNWAYGPKGSALKGKYCLNALTAGGPRAVYSASGRNHYSINEFLRPFEQTASLCGMHYLPPYAITDANRIKSEEIARLEKQYQNVLTWLGKEGLLSEDVLAQQFINDAKIFNHEARL